MDKAEQIELLNLVINQPEVLAEMAPGYLRVDMAAFFDKPGNVMFGDERGVVMFSDLGEGVFQMDYALTTSMRGPAALRLIKESMASIFTYHGAHVITGLTPRENRAARAVNRALGGRPYGVSVDSQGRDCIAYKLERVRWAALSGA